MPLCYLCLQEKAKLAKSHIVPAAFWREAKAGPAQEPPYLLSRQVGFFPRRAPVGVYDQTILCPECEKLFQDVDDYGSQVLLQDFSSLFMPVMEGGVLRGFESTQVDQMKLLRFFVSVAWRASVSTQAFFRKVELKDHLVEAAKSVQQPSEDVDREHFSCMLTMRRADGRIKDVADSLISPVPKLLHGASCFELPFGRAVAVLRVGQPAFPALVEQSTLASSQRLQVLVTDFARSADIRTMVDVVKGSKLISRPKS
ncbi:hypothetical protein D3C85_491730 [compost metagenome]